MEEAALPSCKGVYMQGLRSQEFNCICLVLRTGWTMREETKRKESTSLRVRIQVFRRSQRYALRSTMGISRSTEPKWKLSPRMKRAMMRSCSLIPVVREGDGERRGMAGVCLRNNLVEGGVHVVVSRRRGVVVEFGQGSRGEAMVAV